MDINTLITLLTTLLAAIGVGLGLVWKYFTDQDAKKTEIILKQVEEAKSTAADERQRADLIREQFLETLSKADKRAETTSNRQEKLMAKHLKALEDLTDSIQQLVEKTNKERS